MPQLKHFKVLDALPSVRAPDAVYYVAEGDSVAAYVTSSAGVPKRVMNASRTKLLADAVVYVSPSGNDTTGNGTETAPWRNIWTAWIWISHNIDLNGYTLTIQLSPGTYLGGFSGWGPVDTPPYDSYEFLFAPVGVGKVVVQGDVSAPQNYIIIADGKADWTCFEPYGTNVFVRGVWMKPALNGDWAIGSYYGAVVDAGQCIIGDVGGPSFNYAGTAYGYSFVNFSQCEFRGPFNYLAYTAAGGVAAISAATVTSVQVASAALFTQQGRIVVYNSFTGTITGKKAIASQNGVIIGHALVNATIAATADTGGQLI